MRKTHEAAGINPIQPALGATLGASMGFMPITAMIRHGIVLDIAGFVVIVGLLAGLGRIF